MFDVLSSSCSSPSPPPPLLFSPVPSSLFPMLSSQQDSASSEKIPQAFSLICSIVWFRDITLASFSLATLCQAWFSISNFLRKSSSSIALLVAFAISSSFCLKRANAFDSTFRIRAASCCFLCSCKTNLNLSLCKNREEEKSESEENPWDQLNQNQKHLKFAVMGYLQRDELINLLSLIVKLGG